jgi:hypothetical protein
VRLSCGPLGRVTRSTAYVPVAVLLTNSTVNFRRSHASSGRQLTSPAIARYLAAQAHTCVGLGHSLQQLAKGAKEVIHLLGGFRSLAFASKSRISRAETASMSIPRSRPQAMATWNLFASRNSFTPCFTASSVSGAAPIRRTWESFELGAILWLIPPLTVAGPERTILCQHVQAAFRRRSPGLQWLCGPSPGTLDRGSGGHGRPADSVSRSTRRR